jgi:hypothetical protein
VSADRATIASREIAEKIPLAMWRAFRCAVLTPLLLDACTTFGDGAGSPTSTDAGNFADAGTATGYVSAVLADHPLVYFRLGEGSGIRAADSSGHGTDGVYLGDVKQRIPGAIAGDTDTAVTFGTANGDAEKIRLIAPFDFANVAPFSLEAWVKPEAPGDGAFSEIIGRAGWSLFMQYDVGWVKFARNDADGGWDGPWYTTTLPRERFTHIVGTFDGATMHLYIDGLDVGGAPSTRVVPSSTEPILIGPHLPATLDEVAIYDYALAPERVRAHHRMATDGP